MASSAQNSSVREAGCPDDDREFIPSATHADVSSPHSHRRNPLTGLNTKISRRCVLQSSSLLAAAAWSRTLPFAGAQEPKAPTAIAHNNPETLVADPRVNLTFGDERMILDDGLQPSMLCTKSGTLVVQSQLSKKPHPQERIFYPYAVERSFPATAAGHGPSFRSS